MNRISSHYSVKENWLLLLCCTLLCFTLSIVLSSCAGSQPLNAKKMAIKKNKSQTEEKQIDSKEFADLKSKMSEKAIEIKKIPTLNEQLAALQAENEKTNKKLEIINGDVGTIKKDITEIKTDIEDIKNAINIYYKNMPRDAKTGVENNDQMNASPKLNIPASPDIKAIDNSKKKSEYTILSDEMIAPKKEAVKPSRRPIVIEDDAEEQLANEKLKKAKAKLKAKAKEKEKKTEILDNVTELRSKEKKKAKTEEKSIETKAPTGENFKKALVSLEQKNYQDAINKLNEVLKSEKDASKRSECNYRIGESYYGLKQFPKAVDYFTKVVAIGKNSRQDDAQPRMPESLLKMGQTDKAKQSYAMLITKYPDSEYVPKARKMLQQL